MNPVAVIGVIASRKKNGGNNKGGNNGKTFALFTRPCRFNGGI